MVVTVMQGERERGEAPLHQNLPLSFEGEGDKGGEVEMDEATKQKTIIDEMDEFRTLLIGFTVLRKKIIMKAQKLTDEEQKTLSTLFDVISIDAGKYGPLIKEITGLETIHTGVGPQDIWNWALNPSPNTIVINALDNCVSATSRTIGTLEKDIKSGVRDKQGNKIEKPQRIDTEPPKAFISHGKKSVALTKLEEFLRAIGVDPLIAEDQPSLDKTVDDKVNYYLSQADCVIILATGDDEIEGKLHPRQNVIHEIGLAQKTHVGKIIYLLEEGAEFPSNISPKVWKRFKQRNMQDAFFYTAKELRAFGVLKAVKP